jgi:hypothetical protein
VLHDEVYAVPNGTQPFRLPIMRADRFNDTSQLVHVTYSSVTNVDVAAVKAT